MMPRERPQVLPTNAVEFEVYMVEMDHHFANIGLAVTARSLAGMTEAGMDQGATSVRLPKAERPTPGNYEGENLLLHAEEWFRLRYPAQATVDLSLGSTVVILHGQVWEYRVPYGGWGQLLHTGNELTSPATVQTAKGYPNIPPNEPIRSSLPGVNLMQGLVGFPGHLAESLDDPQRVLVVQAYCRAQLAFFWLTRARYHKFIREALGDCASSVEHLLRNPPAVGISKWESLQLVEKVFKSYLHHSRKEFPTSGRDGHSLSVLAALVAQAGGPTTPPADLTRVQCSAGVRYEASGLTIQDGVDSHYAALEVVDEIGTELCNRLPLPSTPPMNDLLAEARDRVRVLGERIGLSSGMPE